MRLNKTMVKVLMQSSVIQTFKSHFPAATCSNPSLPEICWFFHIPALPPHIFLLDRLASIAKGCKRLKLGKLQLANPPAFMTVYHSSCIYLQNHVYIYGSFWDLLPPHKRRGHHLSIFKRRQSRQTWGTHGYCSSDIDFHHQAIMVFFPTSLVKA